MSGENVTEVVLDNGALLELRWAKHGALFLQLYEAAHKTEETQWMFVGAGTIEAHEVSAFLSAQSMDEGEWEREKEE